MEHGNYMRIKSKYPGGRFSKNHKIYTKISPKIDKIRSTKIRLMKQFSKLVLAYLMTNFILSDEKHPNQS